MGVGGSKASCICFACKDHQSVGNKTGCNKNEKNCINVVHSTLPIEAKNSTTKVSLRSKSSSSMKPGQKNSLENSSYVQVSSLPENLFDPDNLISIHDLYNLLNDGTIKPFIHDPFNLLLVDLRDLKYFSESRIITAKHHASVMGNSNFAMRLSNYSMVIIYGDELKNDEHTKQLANARNDIGEYVASDILILKEGFNNFQNIYSFLCTDQVIESVNDRKLLISYPSVVLENQLYQGRGDQATNEKIINSLKITHIVNISTEHKNAFTGKLSYLKLVLEDTSNAKLFQHFYEASDFINNSISKGGRVLVHCNMGVSRSSTITLSYLMRFKKWNLEQAFSVLKARRSCACPNPGFFQQLSDWELEVFGERKTNIDSL